MDHRNTLWLGFCKLLCKLRFRTISSNSEYIMGNSYVNVISGNTCKRRNDQISFMRLKNIDSNLTNIRWIRIITWLNRDVSCIVLRDWLQRWFFEEFKHIGSIDVFVIYATEVAPVTWFNFSVCSWAPRAFTISSMLPIIIEGRLL